MIDLLLPLLYAFLFGNIIYRTGFFSIGAGKNFLLGIFLIKCVLSALYWVMHVKDYGGGDTFFYFIDGEIIAKTLQYGPWKYLHLVFGFNGGKPAPNIYHEVNLMVYWWDTSAYMVVRFNALVYLFSFGNPYVHGIFMSFLSLAGLTAFYKGIIKVIAHQNLPLIRFAIFGIPSVLFWTSGVHKEGLLILGLGFFFYSILSFKQGARNLVYLNILIVSSLLIFLVRDFVFYLLMPGMLAWQASKVFPRLGPVFIVGIYVFLIVAAPALDVLPGHKNYMQVIADKQTQFKQIKGGNTDFEIPDFQARRKIMVKQLPGALYNATLRPLTLGVIPLSHANIFIETLLLLLIVLLSIIFFDLKTWHYHPLMAWLFSFGVSLLALIGFIVPNVGAVVRYRSLALPFIFVPLLYYIKPVVFDKLYAIPAKWFNNL